MLLQKEVTGTLMLKVFTLISVLLQEPSTVTQSSSTG